MSAVIKTNHLTKKYGSFYAVKDVGITVKEGAIYGLIGKNGAGKTTLFKILSGITSPSSGELELFGQSSVKELGAARKRIGCLIETPNFFSYLSAEKNLEYYRIQRGIAGRQCIQEALQLVELTDAGHVKYKDFSLGMKQRLGFALAVMGSPDLLILDEPVNGLDPIGIVKVREILKRLNTERHMTILISSHILSELSQVASTYGFVDNGMLLEECSAKELEDRCRQYLLLKVNDVSSTVVILEDKTRCHDYEVLNNNTIRVYGCIEQSDVLARILVENGISLYSITKQEASLENYFMDLIGGNKHD